MPFFRKAKIVQKRKEQVIHFLGATGRRQSGLFVYQIILKNLWNALELTLAEVWEHL